ncbi:MULTISPECIES: Hint domain-containing protein [Roseobacteraceae]|uniref:Hint domain protein n=1 Tax=Pseudosulfitobacter pseudonitzschiae TaxID=1402135 RepID=A0A221K4W3_9RHOB|nr:MULTISPECIES: Hint domain-containing protein [Roseobacteraceae]ASM74036.1 Hint domain protein [Pseudosulfitobacter pseudonitzschiae]
MVAASELPIRTVREGTDATDMAETIFGDGVTVVGATYSGDRDSAGIYSNGDNVAPGATPSDTGVILSTGDAQDFTNRWGSSNQSTSTSTNTSGRSNDSMFNQQAGANTYDAAWLDIDFIPTGDVMTMQFVFSSEEYPEFQNSVYQDFVGVWINGQFVEMTIGDGDTDPGNVNQTNNLNMFLDNSNDAFNTEMDGLTITMTLTIPVISGSVNSIRIGIADVSDSNYDSNLLIAADSMQTLLIANTDDAHVAPDGSKVVDVLANDVNNGNGSLTITHINNMAVVAGQTITLPTGQQVMLNADGTLTLIGDGDSEDFNFTYQVDNGDNTDIGYVNVSSIPCFVAGTMIATPTGEARVEDLVPGDLVMTQDEGAQPLRWIGQRTVAAAGKFAPVCVRANTFGTHRELLVSPEHRILIRDSLAELLFGEAEVLVAAKDLVNDRSVRARAGGEVTYVHLMFDKHQVVFSEGLATESFLPGPQTEKSFEQDILNEICALFPELDPSTGQGYSPAARRTLKHFEADLWRRAQKVA